MLQAALMASLEEPHPRRHDDAPQAGDRSVASRDLEGAPYVRAEAQEELLALKSGAVFVCARPDGDIRAARVSGEGLYAQDTRHLSELRLTVGGVAPVLLSSTMESGHHAIVNATNPTLRDDNGAEVAQETVNVRRTVLVEDRLYYRVRVRNFGPRAITTTVEVVLAADFADVFDVRGVARRTSGRLLPPEREANRVRLAYAGEDGGHRETVIELSPSPGLIALDDRGARATWNVALEPREATTLQITVDPARRDSVAPALEEASARLNAAHEAWERACARITTDNELFDRFIDASIRDLHALDDAGAGRDAACRRDPLVRRAVRPRLAADRMRDADDQSRRRARHAARARRACRRAPTRPGVTPSRARSCTSCGRASSRGRGHIPHTPYYGTVDATPLFLALAGAYHRWTLDIDTMAALRPAFDAALEWIDRWGDSDGDGFVEYQRRSPGGLRNQGWKDSRRLRSCTRTARWPRARSRSSRSRATSTRASCGSPRSTTPSGDTDARGAPARRGADAAGGLQRRLLGRGGGLLRARARRTQASRSAA